MTGLHYHNLARSMVASSSSILVFLLLLLSGGRHSTWAFNPDSLVWEARNEFPGGGRHHPITFANATHGFVLSGSTAQSSYTSDFWVYEVATDSWKNLTGTSSAFPGIPRTQAYGVASTLDCANSKAYLGFGAGNGQALTDLWQFDMFTHEWKQLADFPGLGRRHPAMNFVEPLGEIHVGLGDGIFGNYNDYWSYNIEKDEWKQLDDFPSSERHHPFYFAIDTQSYVGLGHSNGFDPYIERDWYRYDAIDGTWTQEADFASYSWEDALSPVTTEARVAGTEFSVASSCDSDARTLGFVLSGDGNDHGPMDTGEFHVFDPPNSIWHALPPHPGPSRWAPGSFVLQGSTRVYLLGGFDRQQQILFSDLWTIDLKTLFDEATIGINEEEEIEIEVNDKDTVEVNGDSSLAASNAPRAENLLHIFMSIAAVSSSLALIL